MSRGAVVWRGTPVLVVWGYDSGGTYTLRPSDEGMMTSGTSTGGATASGHLIRSGATSDVTVVGRSLSRDRAVIWIALYEPIQ